MENERKGKKTRISGYSGREKDRRSKFVKIPTVVSDRAKVIDAKDESIGTRPICTVADLIGPNRSVRAET